MKCSRFTPLDNGGRCPRFIHLPPFIDLISNSGSGLNKYGTEYYPTCSYQYLWYWYSYGGLYACGMGSILQPRLVDKGTSRGVEYKR